MHAADKRDHLEIVPKRWFCHNYGFMINAMSRWFIKLCVIISETHQRDGVDECDGQRDTF